MSSVEEVHRVTFTVRDAIRLGIDYIKRRFQRTIINVSSIALANSFLSSLILTDLFFKTYSQLETTSLSVEAYQYWLVFVALIVSIVGITNAMLIAVYERYNEIGTMKCIGALDQHIMMLFLVESSIQGLSGGVIGYILGVLAALVSTGMTTGFDIILKVPISTILFYFVGTTLLSGILSVIASLYPAWRASKLRPVEALRYEL
ncbi:MAG: FtsX-like permease family protein [Candidatus Bathyarchaeota archaeon]|nr:FtsX-like permease family protein [Candidatus Bathyarchaeota archaeon]